MARKSVTIRAAWITGGFAVAAAIVGGVISLSSNDRGTEVTNVGSGQQVVGDHNTVTVNALAPKRVASLDIFQDTDIHLGDNVLPGNYGVSYNPLTQDIYPQPVKGVVFFDKSSGTFLSDQSGPTQIGLMLATLLQAKLSKIDFSAYKYVHATSLGEPNFEGLTQKYSQAPQLVWLGPTALIADESLAGNYYSKYAAVGVAKSFSLTSALRKAGIEPDEDNLIFSIVVKAYHGGLRSGQSENFVLSLNGVDFSIPSSTRAMRDPAEIELNIPSDHINVDRTNVLFLYVLPWIEEGPRLSENSKGPAHFRDVGIISLEIVVREA